MTGFHKTARKKKEFLFYSTTNMEFHHKPICLRHSRLWNPVCLQQHQIHWHNRLRPSHQQHNAKLMKVNTCGTYGCGGRVGAAQPLTSSLELILSGGKPHQTLPFLLSPQISLCVCCSRLIQPLSLQLIFVHAKLLSRWQSCLRRSGLLPVTPPKPWRLSYHMPVGLKGGGS